MFVRLCCLCFETEKVIAIIFSNNRTKAKRHEKQAKKGGEGRASAHRLPKENEKIGAKQCSDKKVQTNFLSARK
jgi:hypothetical protein